MPGPHDMNFLHQEYDLQPGDVAPLGERRSVDNAEGVQSSPSTVNTPCDIVMPDLKDRRCKATPS